MSAIPARMGVLILLFSVDWRAGLAMSTFAAFALVILMLIRRRAIPYWVQLRQVSADFSSFLKSSLRVSRIRVATGPELPL